MLLMSLIVGAGIGFSCLTVHQIYILLKNKKILKAIGDKLDSYESTLGNMSLIILKDTIFYDASFSESKMKKGIIYGLITHKSISEAVGAMGEKILPPSVIDNLTIQMRERLMKSVPAYTMDRSDIASHIEDYSSYTQLLTQPMPLSPYTRYTLHRPTVEICRYIVVPSRIESDSQAYFDKAYKLEFAYRKSLSSNSIPDEELINEYDRRIKEANEMGEDLLESMMFEIKSSLDHKALEKDTQTTLKAWEKLYSEE